MTVTFEFEAAPGRGCQAEASCGIDERLDTLPTDEPGREGEAGPDIVGLKSGIGFQNRLGVVACGKHAEKVFDSQSVATNDRLATEDHRVDRDAGQQIRFGHRSAKHLRRNLNAAKTCPRIE